MRDSRTLIAVLAVAALLGATRPGMGQPQTGLDRLARPIDIPPALPAPEIVRSVAVDPAVRALVDALDADRYDQREEAMQRLLDLPIGVAQLCRVLSEPTTNAEQRYRLLAIVRHKLVHAPRGALGISMSPVIRPAPGEPGGVEVRSLIAGLPAEHVLQPFDRIIRIDGHPIRQQRDLMILVQSKAPGETVDMVVARPRRGQDGRFVRDADDSRVIYDDVDVTLELGPFKAIEDPTTGPGLVGSARLVEAAEAVKRYAPRPEPVRIEGAEASGFIQSSADAYRYGDVEEHPLVRGLRHEIQLIESGRLALTEQRRRKWAFQRNQVVARAGEPGRTVEELDYLGRVARRLEELADRPE